MTSSNQLIDSPPKSGEPQDGLISNSFKLAGAGLLVATALQAQTGGKPTDLDILNYALTLENLEAAFYNQGLKQYSSTDFMNGAFMNGLSDTSAGDVYAYLTIIKDHENQHVRTLTSVIKSLGGTPVMPCVYDFGYSNVDQFIGVAQALENTGVMAYDGAIALLTNPALVTASATIATVEARHAAYLNVLNGQLPSPDPYDTAKSMQDILKIAGAFIKSC